MRRLCSNESGPDNSLPSAAARGNQCVEGEREKERERDGERCGSGLESAEMINRRWWHVFVSSGFGWICFQHTANRNKEHLHASRISGQSKPGQSVKIRKELSLQSSYRLYSRCCSANGCSIRTCVLPSKLSIHTRKKHFSNIWEQILATRHNKYNIIRKKMAGSCNICPNQHYYTILLTILVNCRWTACRWRTVISSLWAAVKEND